MKTTVHSLEILEDRIAPAGVLTATFTGGVLEIQGDALANEAAVFALPQGGYEILGETGTTIAFNGAPAAASVVFAGTIKSLNVALAAGDDIIKLGGLVVKGDATVDLGGDKNQVVINGMNVGKTLTILAGAGEDTIQFSDFNGLVRATDLTVKGDLVITPGGGINLTELGTPRITIGGALDFNGSTGTNNFNTIDGAALLKAKSVDLNFGTGEAGMMVTFGQVSIAAALNVAINSPNLSNLSLFGFPLTVGGNVTLTNAGADMNFTLLGAATIKGALTVNGSAANDSVKVGLLASQVGSIDFDLGEGSNTAEVLVDTVKNAVTYMGGGGSDDVKFASGIALTRGSVGSIDLDLGSGTNFATLGVDTVKKTLSYTGGDGDDEVEFASTLAKQAGFDFDLGNGTNMITFAALGSNLGKNLSVVGGTGNDKFFVGFANQNAAVGNIRLDGGDGLNEIGITAFNLSVPGNIDLKHGNHPGQTSTTTVQLASLKTGGALTFASGDGNHTLEYSDLFSTSVGKGIKVMGAGGNDKVTFGSISLKSSKGVTLELGGGSNDAEFTLSNANLGPVTYTGGAGDDAFTMEGDGSLASWTMTAGQGALTAALVSGAFKPWNVKGNISILHDAADAGANDDQITLGGIITKGLTTIVTAAGADNIQIDDSSFGAMSVTTGAGADEVFIDDAATGLFTTFAGTVDIDLGAGIDTLVLGAAGNQAGVIFKKPVTAKGGLDADTVTKSDADNVIPAGSTFDFETQN